MPPAEPQLFPFSTSMVGAYCVNQPIIFTNGALNTLNFYQVFFLIQWCTHCNTFLLEIHVVPTVIDRVQLHYAVGWMGRLWL